MIPRAVVFQRVLTTTVRGSFIADAASMGTLWIYQPADIKKALVAVGVDAAATQQPPEFKNPPVPKFYSSKQFPNHYMNGMLSPFGEQLLFVTKYMAQNDDVNGAPMSMAMYDWASTLGGRLDHATIDFIANIKDDKKYPNCGADDDQTHLYMKIVPVVSRYVDSRTPATSRNQLLGTKVEEVIRVHQNNDKAVAYGLVSARILEAVILSSSSSSSTPLPLLQILDLCYDAAHSDLEMILGSGKSEIIEMVLESYRRGKTAASEYATMDDCLLHLSHEAMKNKPNDPYYEIAARNCHMLGAFTGPIYLLYKIALSSTEPGTIDETTYINAIRENIFAAGDTCGRGVFIGAVVAAAMNQNYEPGGIFESLWEKVEINTRNEIQSYADMIARRHTSNKGVSKRVSRS